MVHSEIDLWNFILKKLLSGHACSLLLVADHQGSSPGRRGFKMAVSSDLGMQGSIGGGIMEHKMVELARKSMMDEQAQVFLRKQVHRSDAPKHRSGMICSGDQQVAIVPLNRTRIPDVKLIIELLENNAPGVIQLDNHGLTIIKNTGQTAHEFNYHSKSSWSYHERLGYKDFLHIIGGGHISLALSKLAAGLDFYVNVYEDRSNLHTLNLNTFAHEKHQVDYAKLGDRLKAGSDQYVVIMTFGYRTDEVALRSIMSKKFQYLGLLGSQAKIDQMFAAFKADGMDPQMLKAIDAPAGMPINSQTTSEIAVSIAAQLIKFRRGAF